MQLTVCKTIVTAASAAVIAVTGGVGLAAASSATPHAGTTAATSGQISGCIETSSRIIENTHVASSVTCPGSDTHLTWNKQGPQGKTGATGATGPQGPAGPAGPGSSVTPKTLSVPTTPITTGGTFATNATKVDTMALPAGTYQVTVNFTAVAVSGTGVAPQMFVFNGPAAVDNSNDLFNLGSGDLQAAGTGHNGYYSGSGVITVPSGGETLDFYAFGDDEDSGSGSYTLKAATVAAVQYPAG